MPVYTVRPRDGDVGGAQPLQRGFGVGAHHQVLENEVWSNTATTTVRPPSARPPTRVASSGLPQVYSICGDAPAVRRAAPQPIRLPEVGVGRGQQVMYR